MKLLLEAAFVLAVNSGRGIVLWFQINQLKPCNGFNTNFMLECYKECPLYGKLLKKILKKSQVILSFSLGLKYDLWEALHGAGHLATWPLGASTRWADCCTEVPLAHAHQSHESNLFIAFHAFAHRSHGLTLRNSMWLFTISFLIPF